MTEQVVHHHVSLGVAAQFDDDPHTVAVGLVPDVRYTVQFLLSGKVRDFLDQIRLVNLIGKFGDDYLFPVTAVRDLFDLGRGFHDDPTTASGVGVVDSHVAEDIGARRKVGALDRPHQLFSGGIWVVDQPDDGVADLA